MSTPLQVSVSILESQCYSRWNFKALENLAPLGRIASSLPHSSLGRLKLPQTSLGQQRRLHIGMEIDIPRINYISLSFDFFAK
jgi:hypothetical protein